MSYALKKKNHELRLSDFKLRLLLKNTAVYLMLVACCSLPVTVLCHAEVVDRVVAFADNVAITLSEFNETFEKAKKLKQGVSSAEVLNTMINRVLLLREARKLKLEAKTDDELIGEYIDVKVRPYARVRDEDLEDFYNKNLLEFKGSSFDLVREKIEGYLMEREVNNLLKRNIDELREKTYVKITMEDMR